LIDEEHGLLEEVIKHHGTCQLFLALFLYVSHHVVVAGDAVAEV